MTVELSDEDFAIHMKRSRGEPEPEPEQQTLGPQSAESTLLMMAGLVEQLLTNGRNVVLEVSDAQTERWMAHRLRSICERGYSATVQYVAIGDVRVAPNSVRMTAPGRAGQPWTMSNGGVRLLREVGLALARGYSVVATCATGADTGVAHNLLRHVYFLGQEARLEAASYPHLKHEQWRGVVACVAASERAPMLHGDTEYVAYP